MPDDPGFDSGQGKGIFLFSKTSRPAVGSTQPPTEWVRENSTPPPRSRGIKLTVKLDLLPRFRMTGAIRIHSVKGGDFTFTFTMLAIRRRGWGGGVKIIVAFCTLPQKSYQNE